MAELLQQLRDLLIRVLWEAATELLRQLGPDNAAGATVSLQVEQQRILFRHLPTDFAAKLAGAFPYFHTYVLFHTLTASEIATIVDESCEFLDALPGVS